MKRLIYATLAILMLGFASCSKDKDDDTTIPLSEAQKKAIAVLNGKFVYTLYTITISYTFGAQYNPPKLVTVSEDYATGKKEQLILHGEATYIYSSGETSPIRYYYVYPNADKILFMTSNYRLYKYDFKVISSNEFRIKDEDDVLWDTYLKQ